MKISNKEKILLYILGIIVVGFGYYNYVYKYQSNLVHEKELKESELEKKYSNAIETINALEDRKNDNEIMRAKVQSYSKIFYPVISEEHIIQELDKLLNDSGLKGGITFEPTVSAGIEPSKIEKVILPDTSFKEIVKEYEAAESRVKVSKENNDKDVSDDSKEKVKDDTENKSNSESNSDDDKKSKNEENDKSKETKGDTVHLLKCSINFEGNYEALNKFLQSIGDNERRIVVNSINVDKNSLEDLTGTMNLEIYAVPKIDDEIIDYLKWDFDNTYGKNIPFDIGAASGITKNEEGTADFILSVKSIDSDLPTVILGRAKDNTKASYVYANSNGEEKIEIALNQDGEKYYYKYKTSKGSSPKSNNKLGTEFIPIGDSINLDVFSESRSNDDDKSSVKIEIENNTNKLFNVNINGEDSESQRVKVNGDSSKVSVNQK